MNSIISDHFDGHNYITITDQNKISHINSVLRCKIGDSLKITVLNLGIGIAKCIQIKPFEIKLELIGPLVRNESFGELIIGISRPVISKKILEHSASMGIKKITFFLAELSEKSYLSSKVLEEENIQYLLSLGISQSAHYCQLPEVDIFKKKLKELKTPNTFLLDKTANHSFISCDFDFSNYKLLIGPERGFSLKEMDQFQSLPRIKLSSSTLRVENAVFTALGQIELLRLSSKI